VSTPANPFTLADWRHAVAEHYAAARRLSGSDGPAASREFRAARERLFREHPESPIASERRAGWRGFHWYPYSAAWRVRGVIDPTPPRQSFDITLASDGVLRCTRVGQAKFAIAGRAASLAMYWFEGYGGGLWLPFSDVSSGTETYGGGRYLYDTIKGADLGVSGAEILLDFNFAYNPSCVYEDRWSCPLSPPENRLAFAVTAGERMPICNDAEGVASRAQGDSCARHPTPSASGAALNRQGLARKSDTADR
jgi:uncharacterized protein (DUF1684 family)